MKRVIKASKGKPKSKDSQILNSFKRAWNKFIRTYSGDIPEIAKGKVLEGYGSKLQKNAKATPYANITVNMPCPKGKIPTEYTRPSGNDVTFSLRIGVPESWRTNLSGAVAYFFEYLNSEEFMSDIDRHFIPEEDAEVYWNLLEYVYERLDAVSDKLGPYVDHCEYTDVNSSRAGNQVDMTPDIQFYIYLSNQSQIQFVKELYDREDILPTYLPRSYVTRYYYLFERLRRVSWFDNNCLAFTVNGRYDDFNQTNVDKELNQLDFVCDQLIEYFRILDKMNYAAEDARVGYIDDAVAILTGTFLTKLRERYPNYNIYADVKNDNLIIYIDENEPYTHRSGHIEVKANLNPFYSLPENSLTDFHYALNDIERDVIEEIDKQL